MSSDHHTSLNTDDLGSYFEERAENLSRSEITDWTADTPNSDSILRKLMGPGAKLLVGPRGCGKSTFLRVAFFNLSESQKALPIYVNYSKSLALEPLYHTNTNASILFRQWILYKIIAGLGETIDAGGIDASSLDPSLVKASREFIGSLQVGIEPTMGNGKEIPFLSIEKLKETINDLLATTGQARCVLLLDDAAHAFSQDQQREFFEVFRELTSRVISPKAAVYPGATSYSKNFNVGHDAELIEAWVNPADESYLNMMRSLAKRRFPKLYSDSLEDKQDLADLLAYASFGIPRAFINSIASMVDVETGHLSLKRASALGAIDDSASAQRLTFQSLAKKLPRFEDFISLGEHLLDRSITALRLYNRIAKSARQRALEIAVEDNTSATFDRVIQLLQYSGVIREVGNVSRGVKGRFCRYEVHSAILISHAALAPGKSFQVRDLVRIFAERSAHAFVRRREATLLDPQMVDACRLRLPACISCNAERLSEEQRFCASCGAELTTASIYRELLNSQIDELPITEAKKTGIKAHTSLRTIQDILSDDDGKLRIVPGIGCVWQAKIRNAAEEYVSV